MPYQLEQGLPSTPQSADHRGAKFHLLHNHRLTINILILSLSYICFGYDASVIGGTLAMPAFIKQFGTGHGPHGTTILTATNITVMSATRTAASVPALFICSYCGNNWGRKKTIWLGCLITLVGTALQTASTTIPMMTVGLTLAGGGYFIMVSMASTLGIELAPPSIRGVIGTISVVAQALAALLSSGVAWGTYTFTSSAAYRVPLGLQNFWPLFMGVCMLYVMDSPTSYLINGDVANAEKSLRLVRSGYSEEEIAKEMQTLQWQDRLRRDAEEVSWTELFRGVNFRRTALAAYAGILCNLSGNVFTTTYATIFLTQTGSTNPFLLVFALGILTLGGAVTGLVLVDIIGRRNLALIAFSSISVINIILGGLGFANLTTQTSAKAIASFVMLSGFVYPAFLGPLVWLNAAEVSTARLRNVTNAYVLLCISLSALTIGYVVPFITNADAGDLGPKTYWIFAGFMLIGLVITWFEFPELKGRTPAELDEMFKAKLPARKFKGYQCNLVDENLEVKTIETEGDVKVFVTSHVEET